jgi:mono/diheme cytochrome c family protein
VIGALVAVFVVIQLIPYGRDHDNPPVTNAFVWTDPAAEAIARSSCYDCHSNETRWWWATNIAPASWLVWRDVSEGRSRLNFSQWDGSVDAEAIREAVNGEMPPFQYTIIHPGARLSEAEKQALTDGFAASLASGQSTSAGSTPTPSPTAEAAVDAVTVIDQRCSTCHSADQALAFRAGDPAEAQALIDSMKQRGAQLTGAEEQALVEYFTR